MDFTFEYSVDQREQVRASQIMYHRKWSTRAVYAFFLLLLLTGPGLYLRDLALGRRGWLAGMAIIVTAAVAGAGASYLSPYWMIRSLRKNNRSAAGPHRYHLHPTGIDVTSPGASATLEWANIVEAYETPEFLFFYFSKSWATMLPKRVVSADELLHLRTALRGWLGDKARLLPA